MSLIQVGDFMLTKYAITRIKIKKININTYVLNTQSRYNCCDLSFHDYRITYYEIKDLMKDVETILDDNPKCYLDYESSVLMTSIKE